MFDGEIPFIVLSIHILSMSIYIYHLIKWVLAPQNCNKSTLVDF